MRLLALTMLLACADLVSAQDPVSADVLESAEEKPLDLGNIEVVGEGFSFEQEVTLRIIKNALYKPKSQRQEDRDDWLCWIDDKVGTHLKHLSCARNGDLWALERPFGLNGPTTPIGGYGTIMTSSRPVNRWKLEQALESLEGSEAFDQEFLSMVVEGERPPRDIPDEEELDQFARAYTNVGRLYSRGASEQRQINAIQATGLSLQRYNRIAELTETFITLKEEVAQRLNN